jgi:hypothetical protein
VEAGRYGRFSVVTEKGKKFEEMAADAALSFVSAPL